MNRRAIVAIAIVAVALSASGCKRLEKRFTPPPTVVTEEATRAATGAQVQGELDSSTPQGLPLWPGAVVVDSTKTEDAYSLTLTTADTFSDALSGVAAGFEDAGWTVARDESGAEGARSAILEISRDSEEGFVTLTELEDGSTQIDYVITAAEK
jgi:hypothetical protein